MKLLVTGGLGFIGTNFIKYTTSRYPETHIINIDKIGIGSNPENLSEFQKNKNTLRED